MMTKRQHLMLPGITNNVMKWLMVGGGFGVCAIVYGFWGLLTEQPWGFTIPLWAMIGLALTAFARFRHEVS